MTTGSFRALPLDYAPATRRFRKWRLRGSLLVLLVALGFFARPRLTLLWHQRDLLIHQYPCLNYNAPAEEVVYEGDLAAAAILRSRPDFKQGWRDASAAPTPVAMYLPPYLEQLQLVPYGPFPKNGAVLFLHERRSTKGVRQLVIISCDSIGNSAHSILDHFETVLWHPLEPGVDNEGIETSSSSEISRIPTKDYLPIRFFAGQTDRADESHFTIVYELEGERGTIDGWLEPDGESVRMEMRDGPAKEK